jgi:hypothetical protein
MLTKIVDAVKDQLPTPFNALGDGQESPYKSQNQITCKVIIFKANELIEGNTT